MKMQITSLARVIVLLLALHGAAQAQPVLTSISGCTEGASMTLCPQAGGVPLTIVGTGLGSSGGLVLVGGILCANLLHDLSSPATQVTCTLPPGIGTQPVVYVLDDVLSAALSLTYVPCAPGTFTAGLACVPCTAGTAQPLAGQSSCAPCPPGTAQGSPGAASCVACGPGTAQPAPGALACTPCPSGTGQPNPGQTLCLPDPPVQKCFKAADAKMPKFSPLPGVALDDQFQSALVEVKSPSLLCSPTGARAGDPSAFQCCYKLKAAKLPAAAMVHVDDAFGSLVLGIRKPQLVCQPCTPLP
jgi:hypothetical protein